MDFNTSCLHIQILAGICHHASLIYCLGVFVRYSIPCLFPEATLQSLHWFSCVISWSPFRPLMAVQLRLLSPCMHCWVSQPSQSHQFIMGQTIYASVGNLQFCLYVCFLLAKSSRESYLVTAFLDVQIALRAFLGTSTSQEYTGDVQSSPWKQYCSALLFRYSFLEFWSAFYYSWSMRQLFGCCDVKQLPLVIFSEHLGGSRGGVSLPSWVNSELRNWWLVLHWSLQTAARWMESGKMIC